MHVVHGTYRFGCKRIAAQKDFCNACEDERLTEQWRSFDWVHLYWIPIVPLGYRRRWLCVKCGKDPRARYRTGTWAKIAAVFVTAIFFVAMCFTDHRPDEEGFIWGARIFFGAAFVASLYWVLKLVPKINDAEIRRNLTPLRIGRCIYCNGSLDSNPELRCSTCQIQFFGERAE